MRETHTIVLASTNKDKLEEFQALFQTYPDIVIAPAQEHIRNAEKMGQVETFSTYEENAIAKARTGNRACHYPCLADDSGLEVLALDGKPGPRSARFAIPRAGVTQSQANIEKLIEELRGKSQSQWEARFVCCLALCMEGVLITAKSELKGRISAQPHGQNGFGYDPIFIPEGMEKTIAQLQNYEKNKISHRARAVDALMTQVLAKGLFLAKP